MMGVVPWGNDEDDPVVHLIFAEACRKNLEERADYLDEACGADGEFRQRLDVTLEGLDKVVPKRSREAVELPERIGDCEVIRKLEQGAMGFVHPATAGAQATT